MTPDTFWEQMHADEIASVASILCLNSGITRDGLRGLLNTHERLFVTNEDVDAFLDDGNCSRIDPDIFLRVAGYTREGYAKALSYLREASNRPDHELVDEISRDIDPELN